MMYPQDVIRKLQTDWERGYFYKHYRTCFPYDYRLPSVTSKQMTENYDLIRTWIKSFKDHQKLSPFLCYKEVNHRLFGKNMIPDHLRFESPEDLALLLGKRRKWDEFINLTETVRRKDERLYEWAMGHPIKLLETSSDLDRLLLLWEWMIGHPRAGIYLRQIDVPMIDTKFTEKHKQILYQWLNITADKNHIDENHRGVAQFERRFGFKDKPELVRFRLLDPRLYYRGCEDISIPSGQFCQLFQADDTLPVERVFVIENDICALSFPNIERSLVIFGRGYNFNHLKECAWLNRTSIWYWGDIDTHGFSILSQFRSLFPSTSSFLMDRKTLMDHQNSWGREPKPFTGDPHHLNDDERALYQDLVSNTIRDNLRLEQELISYNRVQSAAEFCKDQV